MNNLPASITKLEVASSNGRDLIALTRLTQVLLQLVPTFFSKLKCYLYQLRSFKEENDRLEYPDMPLILKSLGPHLESLSTEGAHSPIYISCVNFANLFVFRAASVVRTRAQCTQADPHRLTF
jgi:hypothetical protein